MAEWESAQQGTVSRADSRNTSGEALYGLLALAVRHGPREISLTAASTLATLDRTGARRLTDLAVIEGVTQPSMSVLVTGLEQAGLAERRPDPADKRVVLVALTDAGAGYLRSRRRAGAATFADLIDKLPADEAAALAAAVPALNRLRELDNDRRAAAAVRPSGPGQAATMPVEGAEDVAR
jgi:DNA-binding MarR family transcriptional regulator